MASASEAFGKFSIWHRLKTPLKVTSIVNGKTESVFSALIFAVDADASQVGIGVPSTRSVAAYDVEDATFSVEDKRLVATRNESDWLIFEEEES